MNKFPEFPLQKPSHIQRTIEPLKQYYMKDIKQSKPRSEIYCELLNDLFLKRSFYKPEYNDLQQMGVHVYLAAEATRLLLDTFEEIDVIIWDEKSQTFKVKK